MVWISEAIIGHKTFDKSKRVQGGPCIGKGLPHDRHRYEQPRRLGRWDENWEVEVTM
jgi:hypothetical protein